VITQKSSNFGRKIENCNKKLNGRGGEIADPRKKLENGRMNKKKVVTDQSNVALEKRKEMQQ